MPELILTADHPSPSPRLDTSPSCSFSLSPLPSGFLPPAFFSYSFTRPVRSIIGSFASSPSSSLFPQASSICQAKALEGLCLRGKGGHGIVSLIGKCLLVTPRNQKPREFERWGGGGNRSLSSEEGLPSFIFSLHLIGETAHQGIAPAPSLC